MIVSIAVAVAGIPVAGIIVAACAPAEAQRAPGWDVRVAERVEALAGQSAPLPIALAVDRGYTVAKDAQVIIDLVPDDGLGIRKRRLGRGDAVDPDADAPRFAISVRAETPGEHAVHVRVRFWLCGTRTCWPIDVRRTATVAVGAAPGRDAGAATPPASGPK